MSQTNLASMKSISARDRKQIEQAAEMLGPEPEAMGFIKNLFWGRVREDRVFPYPETNPQETARCDQLLAQLDEYLRNEHPHFEIDQQQHIPDRVIRRLFDMGVMGMIIPTRYGGGGYSVTSYNRVLERIGAFCGSTAVMVSAHQSIGCGAIKLFGTDEQKQRFLPDLTSNMLSAFCLSEPNVGCDAAGQETRCELSGDGAHFILNGEKKWATSGAIAGLFTVTAKQQMLDRHSGQVREQVTALIVTPGMEGVEVTSRNRAKCGIRGTWQARIRFNNVRVPKENLLHKQGRGLHVALTCLNYGRCTLSAGMVGAARTAFTQAGKWARYRYQFDRPIAEFELVQEKLAAMAAYDYALDAMLYMTTGFVDRGDDDVMLETAVCKVFCSEMGFRTIDHALQIMGGEGYMTENVVERLWRDSRINLVVEGANEVMHSFVFAYGAKQLGEHLLSIKDHPLSQPLVATRLAAELFLGIRRSAPGISLLHPRLADLQDTFERRVRDFSYCVKLALRDHGEALVTRQAVQYRLSMSAIWLHALACTLSKVDRSLRNESHSTHVEDELALVEHLFSIGGAEIDACLQALANNSDQTMRRATAVVSRMIDAIPNDDFVLPEKTLDTTACGTGRAANHSDIPQFGSGSLFVEK